MSTTTYSSPSDSNNSTPLYISTSVPTISSFRIHTDFEHSHILGRGAFGKVVKVKNLLDGQPYAIKKVKLSRDNNSLNQKILREVLTLSRLSHPNIVRYYQSWTENGSDYDEEGDDLEEEDFEADTDGSESGESSSDLDSSQWDPLNPLDGINMDETDKTSSLRIPKRTARSRFCTVCRDNFIQSANLCPNCFASRNEGSVLSRYLYIQMEYCPKTLKDVLQDHSLWEKSNADIWRLFRQIVEGLAYLHSLDIVHRDLKPDNIFFGRGKTPHEFDVLKIGDFGLATSLKESVSNNSIVGTYLYSSPELNHRHPSDEKVDVYALGIILFEFWNPFNTAMERIETVGRLRKEMKFPENFGLGLMKDKEMVVSLIQKLLSQDPKERLSAEEILRLIPSEKKDCECEESTEEKLQALRRELLAAQKKINDLSRVNSEQKAKIAQLSSKRGRKKEKAKTKKRSS